MRLAISAAVLLVACGSDDGPARRGPYPFTLEVPLEGRIAGALRSRHFDFPAGVAGLGTAASTIVLFTSTQQAMVSSAGQGAQCAVSYSPERCAFEVLATNFDPAASLGRVGPPAASVAPCFLVLEGEAYGSRDGRATLVFGDMVSATVDTCCTTFEDGMVVLNGVPVGPVPRL